MALPRCTYFYDRITNQIIGKHTHGVKDTSQEGGIRLVDSDDEIARIWDDVKNGRKWPYILDKVTDRNPDNLEMKCVPDFPEPYNRYDPSEIVDGPEGHQEFKRRPYLHINVRSTPEITSQFVRKTTNLTNGIQDLTVKTEGGVTIVMDVSVKHSQSRYVDYALDKACDCNDEIVIECDYGSLIPRNGRITLVNGKGSFSLFLPDTTQKKPAKVFAKHPANELIISKALIINME